MGRAKGEVGWRDRTTSPHHCSCHYIETKKDQFPREKGQFWPKMMSWPPPLTENFWMKTNSNIIFFLAPFLNVFWNSRCSIRIFILFMSTLPTTILPTITFSRKKLEDSFNIKVGGKILRKKSWPVILRFTALSDLPTTCIIDSVKPHNHMIAISTF